MTAVTKKSEMKEDIVLTTESDTMNSDDIQNQIVPEESKSGTSSDSDLWSDESEDIDLSRTAKELAKKLDPYDSGGSGGATKSLKNLTDKLSESDQSVKKSKREAFRGFQS